MLADSADCREGCIDYTTCEGCRIENSGVGRIVRKKGNSQKNRKNPLPFRLNCFGWNLPRRHRVGLDFRFWTAKRGSLRQYILKFRLDFSEKAAMIKIERYNTMSFIKQVAFKVSRILAGRRPRPVKSTRSLPARTPPLPGRVVKSGSGRERSES